MAFSSRLDAYHWRAFVGPRLYPLGAEYYFSWVPAISGSSAYPTMTATTLDDDMSASDVFVPLTSVSNWPNKGGVFVGPASVTTDTDERWEYIEYKVKSSGLGELQGINRSDPTTHSSGSRAYLWYPLTTNDGVLDLQRTYDDELLISSWSATIRGKRAPTIAIKPGHCIIVQRREYGASSWDSWSTWLLGVTVNPTTNDGYKQHAPWTIGIAPMSDYLLETELKSVRIGEFDLAENSSGTSITTLAAPYQELSSGDYNSTDVSFGVDNLLSDDDNSLWIANKYQYGITETPAKTTAWTNDPQANISDIVISKIYVNPPDGYKAGRRWVELTYLGSNGGNLTNLRLANNWCILDHTTYYTQTSDSPSGLNFGDHIIIAESKSVFERENPDHGAVAVYDAGESGTGWNVFQYINPAQDGLALLSSGNAMQHIVLWGGQTYNNSTYPLDNWTNDKGWTGNTINHSSGGIGRNQVARLLYADPGGSGSARWWEVDSVYTPGYDLPGYDDYDSDDDPVAWLKIDLPGIGLKLASDITSGSPGAGDTLTLHDVSDNPSVNGLPPSGIIQVGTERMQYVSKDATAGTITLHSSGGNARGYGSTSAAAHDAGDTVYLVVDDEITDAYPVEAIKLTPADSGIRPELTRWHLSRIPTTVRAPNEEEFTADYFATQDNVSWSAISSGGYQITDADNQRIRSFVIKILTLNSQPNRARLKQIEILVNRANYDTEYWEDSDELGPIVSALLQDAGYPSSVISYDSGLPTVDGRSTADDSARNVIAGLLRDHVCTMTVDLKSQVSISANTFWTTTPHTSTRTFGSDDLKDIAKTYGRAGTIKQVLLDWNTDDESSSGTASYPSTANSTGREMEVGPYVVANSGTAATIAKNLYIANQVPYTVTVQYSRSDTSMEPGHIYRVEHEFEPGMGVESRTFVVLDVAERYENGQQTVVWSGNQIDRETTD